MAEEEKDEAAAPEPKKKSPIVLVAILVVVGLLLATGIAFFVSKMAVESAASEASDSSGRHSDPGVFIKLGDAKEGILVNVGGPRSNKYLKTGIVLEMNPGKKDNISEAGTLLPEAETKILDTTMQFLRATKIEDFDATKQDELKKQLKDLLNSVLGAGSVYDVYITSFLLQ